MRFTLIVSFQASRRRWLQVDAICTEKRAIIHQRICQKKRRGAGQMKEQALGDKPAGEHVAGLPNNKHLAHISATYRLSKVTVIPKGICKGRS